MVNNQCIAAILDWLTPGLVSLLIVVTAWRTSPMRGAGWRAAPAALLLIVSLALGITAYLGRAPGVERSGILVGATIAFLATALTLGVYYAIGRFSRRLPVALLVWVVTLVPLYLYALFAFLSVVAHTQCPPDAYECPL